MSDTIDSTFDPPHSQHPTPELRVLILSPFTDIHRERDYLMKQVLPAFREHCHERGVQMTRLDLLSMSIAARADGKEIVAGCLEEINNHRPIIIGIVGDGGDRTGERRAISEQHGMAEIEIIESILDNLLMEGRVCFHVRAGDPATASDGVERRNGHERMGHLVERIHGGMFPVVTDCADAHETGERIGSFLRDALDRFHPLDRQPSRLHIERRAQETFARARRRGYQEIPEYLDRLDRFASGEGPPIIITGASGSGKSSLLAWWSERYRAAHPDAFVIAHYIGAASADAHPRAIIHRIIEEIRERYTLTDPIPTDDDELLGSLPEWLGHVQRERLVLVIDAVNQLGETARDLAWLPAYIPPAIRLILSTVEGPALEEAIERVWEIMTIAPLPPEQRRGITDWLIDQSRTSLPPDLRSRIMNDAAGDTPLFIQKRIEAILTGDDDDLKRRIDYFLSAKDLDELFDRILLRYEKKHGEHLVRQVMSLIWASRHGLDYRELRTLTRANPTTLSNLLSSLDLHLMNDDGLRTFCHDYLKRAVATRYKLFDETEPKPNEGKRQKRRDGATRKLYVRIAGYFTDRPASARAASEAPHGWRLACKWKDLRDCLLNPAIFMELATEEKVYELLHYWRDIGKRYDMVAAYEEMMEGVEDAHPAAKAASLLDAAGGFLMTSGDFEPGVAMLERALAIRMERLDAGRAAIAETIIKLATAYYHLGKLERAGSLLRDALAIYDAMGTPADRAVLRARNDLGSILFRGNDLAGAEEIFRQGLTLCESTYGLNDPMNVEYLNNLGAILYTAGKPERALPLFERAIQIQRARYGEKHPDVGLALGNLGLARQHRREYSVAEEHLTEGLAILQRALGPEHPTTATAMLNLGTLMRETERFDQAEKLMAEALRIRVKVFTEGHPDAVNALSGYTELHLAFGYDGRAYALFLILYPLCRKLYPKDHYIMKILREQFRDLRRRLLHRVLKRRRRRGRRNT